MTTEHDAGRETDALIAERVMGLEIIDRAWPCGNEPECGEYEAALSRETDALIGWRTTPDVIYKAHEYPTEWEPLYKTQLGLWCKPVPHYTTDIAAAWLVVDAMRARGWRVMIYDDMDDRVFIVQFGKAGRVSRNAPTAPLAICRAALAALEATQ